MIIKYYNWLHFLKKFLVERIAPLLILGMVFAEKHLIGQYTLICGKWQEKDYMRFWEGVSPHLAAMAATPNFLRVKAFLARPSHLSQAFAP
jgi:hypothetical protein